MTGGAPVPFKLAAASGARSPHVPASAVRGYERFGMLLLPNIREVVTLEFQTAIVHKRRDWLLLC